MNFLRKLVVDNFQSHEHTEVAFSPGLNVIVGPSDYGKSALVRAMRWLFFNEPKGGDFIRVGARTCRVTVELADGTRLSRLRTTAGRNRYLLQRPGEAEQVFEGFGSEVPQEIIQATGLRRIVIDDRNRAELNFGGQLEGPFLLTENGAVRAKVIGQLGGVHILDWAQKSVATDLRRLRDEDNQLQTGIKRLETALDAYSDLPQLEARIREMEAVMARADELSRRIEALEALDQEWRELQGALENTGRVLEQLAGVEAAERQIEHLEAVSREYTALVSLADDLTRAAAQLQEATLALAKTGRIAELETRLIQGEELSRQLADLAGVARELVNVTSRLEECRRITARTVGLERSEVCLTRAAEILRQVSACRELLANWADYQRAHQGASRAADRYAKEIVQNLAEYRRVLERLGKCPICFGELTPESIERALAEYELGEVGADAGGEGIRPV